MPDAHKNLAYGTVLTPPTPATSGTTVVLDTGLGARFPDPSIDGAFNVRIGPRNARPLPTTSEFARCTARVSDTLTLLRAQEGSAPISVVAGMEVEAGPTANTFDRIYSSIADIALSSLFTRLAPSDTLAIPPLTATDDTPVVGSVTTTPTITVGQIVGPQQVERITEVGCRGVWNASFNRLLSDAGMTGLDFYFTGDVLEFSIFPAVTACPTWIFVNGAPVTAAPTSLSTTANLRQFVTLTFPTVAVRRIEIFCIHAGAWYSCAAANSCLFTAAPRKPVVAFVGDSFWAGSAGTPALQCADFLMARALGVECFSASYGGTGYVQTGEFNTFGSPARVARVAAANPELILMQGSVNDDGAATGAAAAAAFLAYAEACPSAKIIAFGSQPTNATETLSTNRRTNIAAVRAAALAADNVLAFHDMCGTADHPLAWDGAATYNEGAYATDRGSVWKFENGGTPGNANSPGTTPQWSLVTYGYFGTGKDGSPAGNGTRDTYLSEDDLHPTPAGSAGFANICTKITRDDLFAGSL